MNYKIIQNEEELKRFIEWLPNTLPNEQYYICLFARKKYAPEGSNLTADKSQLKRFTATKDRIIGKLKQLECSIGSYTFKDVAIPQEALAVYITPNPRDLTKAGLKMLGAIADKVIKGEIYNPKSLALNTIQISCTRRKYFNVDIDRKEEMMEPEKFDYELKQHINVDCLTILSTRGGYHLLINLSKIEERYKNEWYQGISGMKNGNIDVNMDSDGMIPIPGCTQGGHIPKMKTYE